MENDTKMCSNCDKECRECCGKGKRWKKCGGSNGAVFGLGLIGAAIYYIQNATTFWAGVVGLLKAIVWPAFLVYNALAYFGV